MGAMLASRARQFAGEIMCRAMLAAGVLALLAGGPAVAEPDWDKLAATAADYQGRTWRRVEAGEDFIWVEARDAVKLARAGKGPRKLLVLWPDSIEHVRHVGTGVRYMISEETVDCADKAITSHSFYFGPDHRLMAERVPETEDAMPDSLIYRAVCEGIPVTLGAEAKGAVGVLAIEPDRGP